MHAVVKQPRVPVGLIKSFGPFGPRYEVGSPVQPLDDGDWLVEITLVETGEKTEYRWSRLADDPEAR